MGAFLDKPKTEKYNESKIGGGLRYGLSSMQASNSNFKPHLFLSKKFVYGGYFYFISHISWIFFSLFFPSFFFFLLLISGVYNIYITCPPYCPHSGKFLEIDLFIDFQSSKLKGFMQIKLVLFQHIKTRVMFIKHMPMDYCVFVNLDSI